MATRPSRCLPQTGGLLGGESQLKGKTNICVHSLPEKLALLEADKTRRQHRKTSVNEFHFGGKQQWPEHSGWPWTLPSKAERPAEEQNHKCPILLSELTAGVIFKVKSMPTVQRYKRENGRGIYKKREVMKRDSGKSNSTQNSNLQSSRAVQPAT